jgi:hypothetical protein
LEHQKVIEAIAIDKTAKTSSSTLNAQILSRTIIWAISIISMSLIAGCGRPKPPIEPPSIEPSWVQAKPTPSIEIPETNITTEQIIEPNTSNTTTYDPITEILGLITTDKTEPNEHQITSTEPNEPNIPQSDQPKIPEPNQIIPEPPVKDPNEPNKPEPNETSTKNTVLKKDARDFHEQFAHIFAQYVDKKGLVKYNKLRRIQFELNQLQQKFAKLDPNEYNSWTQNDKIAMWINAWNIQFLRILSQYYPVENYRYPHIMWWKADSIRHINKRLGDSINGIKRQKLTVKGEEFTLMEIQQKIFRDKFAEPKVFFAISQGCLGGPPLRHEPYYGYKLQQQLEEQIKKFVKQKSVFDIDRNNKTVTISTIFSPKEMYGKDFIKKYGTDKRFKNHPPAIKAILNFLTPYLNPQQREFLKQVIFKVNFGNYDWKINDSPEKP